MFSSEFQLFLKDFDKEELYELFIEHFKYGTGDIFIKDGKIVGAVRWNVSKTGRVANILDLFIKDGVDSVEIMRYFGFRGKKKFPSLQYIKFQRGIKFKEDKPRVYKLERLIRG